MSTQEEKYEDKERHQLKWFEMMRLARLCPPRVNDCDITDSNRLLLNILAQHADGDSHETWIRRDTMKREMAVTLRSVDRAIAVLKRSGLVSATRRYNPATKTGQSNIWTLNHELLQKVVNQYEDQLTADQILEFMQERIKSGDDFGRMNGEFGVLHMARPQDQWERIVALLREKSPWPLGITLAPGKEAGEEGKVTLLVWFILS